MLITILALYILLVTDCITVQYRLCDKYLRLRNMARNACNAARAARTEEVNNDWRITRRVPSTLLDGARAMASPRNLVARGVAARR